MPIISHAVGAVPRRCEPSLGLMNFRTSLLGTKEWFVITTLIAAWSFSPTMSLLDSCSRAWKTRLTVDDKGLHDVGKGRIDVGQYISGHNVHLICPGVVADAWSAAAIITSSTQRHSHLWLHHTSNRQADRGAQATNLGRALERPRFLMFSCTEDRRCVESAVRVDAAVALALAFSRLRFMPTDEIFPTPYFGMGPLILYI